MLPTLSAINPISTGRQHWNKDYSKEAISTSNPLWKAVSNAQPALLRRDGAGRRYSVQLNNQVTAAQRAGHFVNDMLTQLTEFKNLLSQQLTQPKINRQVLAYQGDRLQQRWNQRYAASGGRLDAQLQFHANGGAFQRFSVPDLALAALRRAPLETLKIASSVRGAAPAAVLVGDGASETEMLWRFNRALAPSKVRCTVDPERGVLDFNLPEQGGEPVRFTVRGEAQRFPSGASQPLHLEPQASALNPSSWQVDGHNDVRQTLRSVVRAIEQLQHSRDMINRVIHDAKQAIGQLAQNNDTHVVEHFVSQFSARLQESQPIYPLHKILHALLRIERDRVVELLSSASG